MNKFINLKPLIAAIILALVSVAAYGEEFEASVVQALKERKPNVNWRFDETHQLIYADDLAISLDNIKKEAKNRGLDGQDAVNFMVTTLVDSLPPPKGEDEKFDAVKDRVFPVIAPIDYARVAACSRFTRITAICFVVDYPAKRSYVTQAVLASWKLSSEELSKIALENLRKLSNKNKIGFHFEGETDKINYATSNVRDSYDASRILLPNFQALLFNLTKRPAFVAIPNRDFLISWPSGSQFHQQFIRQVAADFKAQSYPLTDELFVIDSKGLRLATDSEKTSGVVDAK